MEEERDARRQAYDFVLHWCVTTTCNFSCPQCAGQAVKMKGKYVPEKIPIRKLMKLLDKLDKTVQIVFTGGEPLFVKNIIKAFAEITKKHYIVLITNLVSDRVQELAEKVDPAHVSFVKASAHLLELERFKLFDRFFANYHLLREKGIPVYVAEVAYPFIVDKVDYYKKMFHEHGIDLEFQAFRGTWKDKKYPEAYTEEEIRIFDLGTKTAYSADIHNHKGDLCNAGYNVVVMNKQGYIFPCYPIQEVIGHIKKGVFLRDTLMRCPVDFCDCPLQVMDPYLFEKALKATGEQKS